ncbi:MAG: hypothetical protein HHJ18_15375 [Polaromonas sp.]|nr:hypothetical protein [Polaromonas sp.]
MLAQAEPEALVEFVSVAGPPARAVPILGSTNTFASSPGNMTPFCIDQQLGCAFDGDARNGLFFRSAGRCRYKS